MLKVGKQYIENKSGEYVSINEICDGWAIMNNGHSIPANRFFEFYNENINEKITHNTPVNYASIPNIQPVHSNQVAIDPEQFFNSAYTEVANTVKNNQINTSYAYSDYDEGPMVKIIEPMSSGSPLEYNEFKMQSSDILEYNAPNGIYSDEYIEKPKKTPNIPAKYDSRGIPLNRSNFVPINPADIPDYELDDDEKSIIVNHNKTITTPYYDPNLDLPEDPIKNLPKINQKIEKVSEIKVNNSLLNSLKRNYNLELDFSCSHKIPNLEVLQILQDNAEFDILETLAEEILHTLINDPKILKASILEQLKIVAKQNIEINLNAKKTAAVITRKKKNDKN